VAVAVVIVVVCGAMVGEKIIKKKRKR